MPLLNHIVSDLRASEEVRGMCSLYFTKESHIHTLLNLILASDLPIVMPNTPPLDYFSSITFEVYERTSSYADRQPLSASSFISASVPVSAAHSPTPSSGAHSIGSAPAMVNAQMSQVSGSTVGGQTTPPLPSAATNGAGQPKPERSLHITISEGAHSSNILSINLDARHSLAPLPRRPLTAHIEFDEALTKLSEHTLRSDLALGDLHRGQIEGDAVYFGGEDTERSVLPVATKQRRGSFDTERSSLRV